MRRNDIVPNDDAQIVLWLNNLSVKLPGYATLLGLTAAEVTAVANDAAAFAYMVAMAEAIKTESQERVAYKDLLRDGPIGAPGGAYPGAYTPPAAPAGVAPGIIPRIRLLIKRIKAHPAYTNAIGEDLGIVLPAPAPVANPKPKGSVAALPGSAVEFKFVKSGFDGVRVESKRGHETAWTSLGNFLRSPGRDDRPPLVPGAPEVRSYRFTYLKGNDTVGQPSDTFTVTTTP